MTSLVETFEVGRRQSMELVSNEHLLSSCYHDSPTPFNRPFPAPIRRTTPAAAVRIVCALTTTTVTLRRSSSRSTTDNEEEARRDVHPLRHASPQSPDSRSASTDLWATSGFIEEDPVMDPSGDEREDVVGLLEPKLELPEDDVRMEHLQASESLTAPDSTSTPCPKRPRGRPRKHPLQDPSAKIQKGRSKRGCITCRRRKKKCDETKPSCLNCAKNGVVCQGYQPLIIWKSGRDKEEEARSPPMVLPSYELAPIIHGVVTVWDRLFFHHYCFRLSAVLTVEGAHKNAFKDMLLPMAVQHLGLMHSILALSSSNIELHEPYGRLLLETHRVDEEDIDNLEVRSLYHRGEAVRLFHESAEKEKQGVVEKDARAVRYAQILCRVVQNLAEGKINGEHRVHLKAYRDIAESYPDQNNTGIDAPFLAFIEEYFRYHIGLDDLIRPPEKSALRLGAIDEDWNLPNVIQPEAVRLLGVQDGLFFYMSKITSIRDTIRHNMEQDIDPVVDYTSLFRAAEIDVGIREWRPSWPPGDSRDLAGLLYKQMMWVYLWRTIYPPKTTTWQPEYRITEVVNEGLKLLAMFPPKGAVQTLLLAPTFIIGCAAFDPAQRPQICASIANIKEYTHLKNADRCLDVLQKVWRFMDEKDERSWDWQSVSKSMGMDFLPT